MTPTDTVGSHRFVVIGAGAVGGVVGGLLHSCGADVVLVARGSHLQRIKESGLILRTVSGTQTLAVPAVGSVAEVDWRAGDIAVLAVKSDATAGLLTQLAAVAPADLPVVCLQNGVANEPAAVRWFSRVYGVCVMAPTTHLEPGVVQADTGPVAAILDIGRYPSGVDDITRAFADAVTAAGMVSEPRPDIMRWKYRKLLANLGNAADAVCRPGPDRDELNVRVRDEAQRVLDAADIAVTGAEEDRIRRGDLLTSYDSGRRGGSSYQSLARGTGAIETDWLNGEIVAIGRRLDVATPANELVRARAVRAARERSAPRSLDAADLLGLLDAIPGRHGNHRH